MEPERTEAAGGAADAPFDVRDEVRSYWDADAETYDAAPDHYPQRPQEVAAWAAALRRLLPEPPTKGPGVGAGPGGLSPPPAAHGGPGTAVDLAPGESGPAPAQGG